MFTGNLPRVEKESRAAAGMQMVPPILGSWTESPSATACLGPTTSLSLLLAQAEVLGRKKITVPFSWTIWLNRELYS